MICSTISYFVIFMKYDDKINNNGMEIKAIMYAMFFTNTIKWGDFKVTKIYSQIFKSNLMIFV